MKALAEGKFRKQKISAEAKRHDNLARYILISTMFMLAGFAQTVRAADGNLDPTFGSGGEQIVQIAAQQRDYATAVAIQTDGKIVVGGELGDFSSSSNHAVLVRLNADGTLDPTFGSGGKIINPGQIHIPALVIQPDGKILTAAATVISGITTNFALVRYNTDGSLDQTFGSGGYADNGLGNATSLILQPDGKIVLVGYLPLFRNGSDYLLARFNSDGSPDQTFGSGGRVTTSFTSGRESSDEALDAVLQPDGKIIATGFATSISVVLIRYNSNGSVDTSFGLDGSVLTPNFGATASRILLQPDGKFIVGGGGFVLGRYNSNGTTDQSFGINGKITGGFGSGSGFLYAIVRQPDGKLLAGGSVSYTGTGESVFALSRYNQNGSLDQSFGNSGFVLTNITEGTLDEAFALALQSNGKAVLAGYAAELGGSYHDFALARYQNTTAVSRLTQFDFEGDGKADVAVYRGGDWYMQESRDGFVERQFGLTTDKITPADFDGDGKTDIAVYRNGTWFILRSSDNRISVVQFGATEDLPVPADYDGDGKADTAVFRPSNGVWYFLRSIDNSFAATNFGLNGDKPVVGDYDGDGKTDIAVYRPSDGAWYLLRSSLGFAGINFGISTDKPVQADYDGDGKTDLAVYRNGVWYISNSRNNQLTAVQYGLSDDVPVPADYDGDSRADVSVFRPSAGGWYCLNSGSSQSTFMHWGASGDTPVAAAFIR